MRINASFLLNAPAWTPKIKKTPRAFIGSFTVCLHKVATTTRKPALRFAGTSFFAGISQSSETQGQSVGSGENTGRKFSSTGERTPGYRLSPNYFQKFKRIPAPDWAQKMLCIIVPNRRTVSPEFFSWVRTRRLLSRHSCPVRSPSFPNQKRRNYRWVEKRFGCYQQEPICTEKILFLTDHNVS